MRYADDRYGFAFELPDGWTPMTQISGRHFELDGQHIQMMTGPALAQFREASARVQHLWEPGCRAVADQRLGEEANTVLVLNDTTGAAAVSSVHEGLHYFFEFDAAHQPASAQAMESILHTFTFPSPVQSLRIVEDFTPPEDASTSVIRQVMGAGSADDARRILGQTGRSPVFQRPGATGHVLPGASRTYPRVPADTWFVIVARMAIWGLIGVGVLYWLRG